MDGGLFVIQQLAIIIGFVASNDRNSFAVLEKELQMVELGLVDVLGILRDVTSTISENSTDQAAANNVAQGLDESDKAVINSWSMNLANHLDQNN